ncbi:MAG: gamma-glutamylcyclotransferase family protein [Nanoarchaeota archaeon]
MESLFVYGNLMDANVQHTVFGRKVEFVYDVLFDYIKEDFIFGRNRFVTIVPKKGFSVNGAILYLEPNEISFLDEKQGKHFHKAKLRLNSGKEAWVYVK